MSVATHNADAAQHELPQDEVSPSQEGAALQIVTAPDAIMAISLAAAAKVHALRLEEEDADLKLRVYITGGGCSGFEYGFMFESEAAADDSLVRAPIKDAGGEDVAEVVWLVDPLSLPYLQGATIDYVSDVSYEKFVITNPNAKTTCGCGSSFSA